LWTIDVIFEEFSAHVKKITIGKHLPTAIYLHIDAIDEIPLVLKHFIIQTVMPIPGIVIVAPPRLEQPLGSMAPKFEGAGEKSEGLSGALQQVAIEAGCHFFDAGGVTTTSRVDGVHLDEDQHNVMGEALARFVDALLAEGRDG